MQADGRAAADRFNSGPAHIGNLVGGMGMIQVDLPMPEACDVCPFNYDFCWCKAFKDDDETWEKNSDNWNEHVCDRRDRPEYCPLKEV